MTKTIFNESDWQKRKQNYIEIDGQMVDVCDSASRKKVKGGDERVYEKLTQLSNPTSDQELVLNLGLLEDGDEAQKNYLDLGEAKDIWYYGFNIKGREAIITSDKKILRNTLEKFKDKTVGENQIKELFNYDGHIGDIAPTISKKAIAEWLTSKSKIDQKAIYTEIRDYILYFMDFGDRDFVADVQACWIIATYCYTLFHWFPHILFKAPSQSGKTKNAFIMYQLSFRGFDLGAAAGVTPAQIYRTLEGNRGTVFIDEFERRDNSESQALVNQILNASASRDAYIIRNEKVSEKWIATKFPIFCPKIVCNISGINPTSLSRFICFELMKSKADKSRRKPQKKSELDKFALIRNKIYFLILENWQEIKQIAETIDIDLAGRDEDNWLPICTIAKWLGNDVLSKVMDYIKSYQEISMESNDDEELLFRTIYNQFLSDSMQVTPKQIAEWLGDELSHHKSPERWIGWRLKKYNIKRERTGQGRFYKITKEQIQKILDVYFSINNVTNVTNDINSINDTKRHNDVDDVCDASHYMEEKYPEGIPSKPFVPEPEIPEEEVR